MGCLYWLLLITIERIEGERTIGGIYHLLTGKHSAQTIQDASLFNCSSYVGSLKHLKKDSFDKTVKFLELKGYIQRYDGGTVVLKDEGKVFLNKLSESYHLPVGYHAGKYEWNDSSTALWNRLSLAIQSLSYLLSNKRNFIPVCYQMDTQQWVKEFFNENKQQYSYISERLHKELTDFLMKLPDREGHLFVSRLTGSERTGKTFQQLCEPYYNDLLLTRLYFKSILHRCMSYVQKKPQNYQLLSVFMDDLIEHELVTSTAKQTGLLLNDGKTIEEIIKLRRLKRGTIEDHLIELAIYDRNFSYEEYITEGEITEVLNVAQQLHTKRLKLIKDELSSNISYFQIRLALTKLMGD